MGDIGSFYLPYVEEAIALELEIRIVCLRMGQWVSNSPAHGLRYEQFVDSPQASKEREHAGFDAISQL